jgi:hypothetical protein
MMTTASTLATTTSIASTNSTDSTTSTRRRPMDPMRRTALAAGLLYLATFVFSIPALALYDGVLHNHRFVFGAGSTAAVSMGALIEIITGLAGIGTAVVLYRVGKRQSTVAALGFVTSRVLEAAMIFVGALSVLSVVTLRQDFVGTDQAGVAAAAQALIALKDWTFLLGPGLMPAVNACCLGYVMYRSRLVPRIIPTIGLIGAPLLLVSFVATLFGAWDQVSTVAFLFTIPIALWEFSLGVWMTFKGFRNAPVSEPVESQPLPFAVPVGV